MIQPEYTGTGDYPPEIYEAGKRILKVLAERAARHQRVFDMLEYLEREKCLDDRGRP